VANNSVAVHLLVVANNLVVEALQTSLIGKIDARFG
ncbi:hypothetical protein AVEN_128802-1, partial [Araneus ventricosus]